MSVSVLCFRSKVADDFDPSSPILYRVGTQGHRHILKQLIQLGHTKIDEYCIFTAPGNHRPAISLAT